jgi:hypothetical protein
MDLLTKDFFVREDFFVRGGLTVDLFHIREGLIFGPALVEAYELESRHAVHPRVVLRNTGGSRSTTTPSS